VKRPRRTPSQSVHGEPEDLRHHLGPAVDWEWLADCCQPVRLAQFGESLDVEPVAPDKQFMGNPPGLTCGALAIG
jgi:hypothetical protein